MTYDPLAYWQAAGADPANSEHESHFRHTAVFERQEEALMATLERLPFRSLLEVGCGFGRITQLVSERWPRRRYTAIDLSPERIESAREKAPKVEYRATTLADFEPGAGREWDLVLAVETLMHIPPGEIAAAVETLCGLSARHVVSLDWSVALDVPIAPWNFRHDYIGLYGERLRSVETVGLQAIYVAASTRLMVELAPAVEQGTQ